MKKIIFSPCLGLLLVSANVFSANIQINDVNVKVEGGFSASALYFDNPGFLKRHDSYLLNDALLELSPEKIEDGRFQFYAGVGVLQKQGINRIYAPLPPVDLKLHYGYLEIPTRSDNSIEIGQLFTLLGYESSVSYKNKHSLLGAVNSAQPDFYSGVRFKGSIGSVKRYIEVTSDPTIGDASWALGIYQDQGDTRYSASYYVAFDERSTIDLLYASKTGDVSWAINLDYHTLEDPPAWQDENATGVAIYVSMRQQQWDWPVRLEYISDGNTGIYGYDSGYTFTFSPTFYFSDDQYLRADFITASADGTPFNNDNGGLEQDQWIVAMQAGITF